MKRFKLSCKKATELLAGIRSAGRQVPGEIRRPAGLTMGSCRHRQMGLTLMELMIVVAIIGILAGIAFPFYFGQVEKARIIKANSELENLQFDITNFELNNIRLPDTLEELGSKAPLDPWGNPYRYLNFATLDEDPEEEIPKKGKGKKKKKKSSTETGDARRIDLYDELINTDYDLYSCGKDGKSAASLSEKQSEDDIVRGQEGGYIGLASGFEA